MGEQGEESCDLATIEVLIDGLIEPREKFNHPLSTLGDFLIESKEC